MQTMAAAFQMINNKYESPLLKHKPMNAFLKQIKALHM